MTVDYRSPTVDYPRVPVVTAAQAAQLDASAIAAGTPSRTLMQRAGEGAAAFVRRNLADRFGEGVAVYAGPGNNGGDAWVVAGLLAQNGVPVRVHEAGPPRTPDAIAERDRALSVASFEAPTGAERVVVDGLLGTGASGAPRGAIAEAIASIEAARVSGAAVIALDVPSGLDASTGEANGAVGAHVTLSFGSVKRGQLLNRAKCGRIVVLDIGVAPTAAGGNELPFLVDHRWVRGRIPPIDVNAHKGSRKRLAIIGGSYGMAGAPILAAHGAFRSGIGLLRLVVEERNMIVAQSTVPQALAAVWPGSAADTQRLLHNWADAVVLGPGLGTSEHSRIVFDAVCDSVRCPMVVDADALNILSGSIERLVTLTSRAPIVLTPHAGEMSRLMQMETSTVLERRFEIALELAKTSGAVVLLKGVPTIIAAPDGMVGVSAAGTPALATGGSGDVLAGILGTLLAQTQNPVEAACCAAWVHGRAGELAGMRSSLRGATLGHVISALSHAWDASDDPLPYAHPVVAELPEISS